MSSKKYTEGMFTIGWTLRVAAIAAVLLWLAACGSNKGISAGDLPPACTPPPTVAGYPPQFCEQHPGGMVCAYQVADCYAVLLREGCRAEWATWKHGCEELTSGEEKTSTTAEGPSFWEGTL